MSPEMAEMDMDAQDRAEVLDETNLIDETEPGADRYGEANFDEIEDVFDATAVADDDDIDGFELAEEDPDDLIDEAFDESGPEEDEERDDRVERLEADAGGPPAAEDIVSTDDEDEADYESERLSMAGPGPDDEAADPADAVPDDADPHVDKQLDHGVEETFPASDPVSINPGAD